MPTTLRRRPCAAFLLLALSLLAFAPTAAAQSFPADHGYVRVAGSEQGTHQGRAVAIRPDGVVFATGRIVGDALFGGCPPDTAQQAGTDQDIFVARYAESGALDWVFNFGGTGGENRARAIDVAVDGGFVVTGGFSTGSNVNVSRTGTFNVSGNGTGNADIFLGYYDENGVTQWAFSIGGTAGGNNERGLGVSALDDGAGNFNGAIASGQFSNSNVDFAPLGTAPGFSGSSVRSTNGGSDIFLARYNASGELVWVQTIGAGNTDRSTDADVTADGQFAYISGQYSGNVDFDALDGDPTTSGADNFNSGATGDLDIFVAKYSVSDGALAWVVATGQGVNNAGSGTDDVRGVTALPDGGVAFGGQFVGTLEINPLGTSQTTSSTTGADGLVAAYNDSGVLQWFNRIQAAGEDRAADVSAYDLDGTGAGTDYLLYAAGKYASGTATFTTTSGVAPTRTNSGGNDVWVGRYSSAGALQALINISGDGDDQVRGIDVSATGVPMVIGQFDSDGGLSDFNPGDPTYGTGTGDGGIRAEPDFVTSGGTTTGTGDIFLLRQAPNLEYRVYAEVNAPAGWRLIGAPAAGTSTTFDDLLGPVWTQGFPNSDNPASTNPNAYGYDETVEGDEDFGYSALSDQTATMTDGAGYLTYIYQDDSPPFDGSGTFPKFLGTTGDEPAVPTSASPYLYSGLTFTANPNDDSGTGDDVPGDASEDRGWNLVSNPFFDTISYSGVAGTNINATIYVYDRDPDGDGDPSDAQYLCYNGSAGDAELQCLSPYQGFWVQANAASPSLRIEEDAFVGQTGFLRRQAASAALSFELDGTLASGAARSSKAYLSFQAESRAGRDENDGYQVTPLTSTYASLYSLSDEGSGLRINALPYDFGAEITIPFGVEVLEAGAPAAGAFTLRWPELRDVPASWSLTLRDLDTGEELDLRSVDAYVFSHEADGDLRVAPVTDEATPIAVRHSGTADARFLLSVRQGAVSTEEDTTPFTFGIESSYPNPFDERATVRFTLDEEAPVQVKVYDVLGRQVATLVDRTLPAGRWTADLDGTPLAAGTYVIQVTAAGKTAAARVTRLK